MHNSYWPYDRYFVYIIFIYITSFNTLVTLRDGSYYLCTEGREAQRLHELPKVLVVQFSSVAQSCPTLCDPMEAGSNPHPANSQPVFYNIMNHRQYLQRLWHMRGDEKNWYITLLPQKQKKSEERNKK